MHATRGPIGVRLLLLTVALVAGCGDSGPPTEPGNAPGNAAGAGTSTGTDNPAAPPLFTEATAELGLPTAAPAFPDGTYALREIMGPGVALFDANGDGRLDLLVAEAPPPGRPDTPSANRFYRQTDRGTFEDATSESGLGDPGAGQGFAIGDIDNDGDEDVFCANFRRDTLYRNDGGTFVNISDEAGIGNTKWTVSAAFLDFDRDGDLDLFAVHYVRFDSQKQCMWTDTRPEYCSPSEFEALADTLYRNNGDGTFTDISLEAGVREPGNGLGVLCLDYTGDGWVDVFVANDDQDNHLWVNQTDGTFREEALLRGLAVNQQGEPEASMGMAAGDSDGDGQLDLFLTHLEGQTNTMYSPLRAGTYRDSTARTGLGRFDRAFTAFGCGFLDFDHDGHQDLAIVNGRVRRGPVVEGAALGSFWNEYGEPNLLMHNQGDGTFVDVSDRTDSFGRAAEIGRGLALGDIDGDGDIDLVSASLGSPVRVYRNDAATGHWLRVAPRTAGRPALGAVVQVQTAERKLVAPCLAASSYASSCEPVAHFGLGSTNAIQSITVTWPDGSVEQFAGGEVDQERLLVQGNGDGL